MLITHNYRANRAINRCGIFSVAFIFCSMVIGYSPLLPTKLLSPVVEPELDFFFNKGYYARINFDNRIIFGRVSRLFVQPLLNALKNKVPVSDFLDYLCAFRYLLSGEFAFTSDLGLNIQVPGDWGLEVGILAEVYRKAPKRICQVDLGYYEQKHKEIGDSPDKGLSKMTYSENLTSYTDRGRFPGYLTRIFTQFAGTI